MQTRPRSKAWAIPLVLPYLAMLWVPSYNQIDPVWMGIPFFYWYQLLWVALCSATVAVVFKLTQP